jgi:Tfp pilus assembly protein PilE
MKRTSGISLIEVLFTFGILAVGLAAISMMVYKGTRLSSEAIDRNAAAMLISEAVNEIEKRHLITANMTFNSMPPTTKPDDEHVGLFIETVFTAGITPNIHEEPYRKVQARSSGTVVLEDALKPTYMDLPKDPVDPSKILQPVEDAISTAMWPMPPAESAKTYGSSPQAPKRSEHYKNKMIADGKEEELEREYNVSYRVLYRLERHPDWHGRTFDVTTGLTTYDPEDDKSSPFVGIYVLTLVPYKDRMGNGKHLEQLGQPLVVYLRDRKAR